MIKMLRIDDRLLHGQVVFMWSKHLNINGIVLANDEILNDPVQLIAMKLTIPNHMKLLIKSVDEAIKILNDPRGKNMNILVVVKDPIDASRIMQGLTNTKQVDLINIGNSGRIQKGDKKKFTKEVYVNEADLKAMKELLTYEIPFEIQMVPTENKTDVKEVMKKFKLEE